MNHCLLCQSNVTIHPVVDEENVFCCPGCHAVYQVLSVRNQLDHFQDHPVFKEALKFGLISNPALLENIQNNKTEADDYHKLHLIIGDLWCPSCAEIIRLMLLCEKGVKNCVVDYATDLASIEFAPKIISKEDILHRITTLGYLPESLQNGKIYSKGLYLRFIIAAFFSLNIMMFSYPIYASYFEADPEGYDHLFAWISLFSSLPVVTYSFWPILRRGWSSLWVGIFGMEALVITGVLTAFFLSLYHLYQGSALVYFDSLTVIITFVLLGKIIEARTKFSSKEAIIRLSHSVPKRGRKQFKDGTVKFVPIKEIELGDILVALTGDKIVLDGIVTAGQGATDESLMTGESIPVQREVGSKLLGGTVLLQGKISYQVTATPEETALQKIIEMIEKDIGTKTVIHRRVDQIIKWFVPAVLAIALGVILWHPEDVILRVVSIFLISCPCAVGIAAPLAESQLMHEMAKLGIIVRNRRALSYLGRESIFIFDKTGTITNGTFHVLSGLENLSEHHLRILKAMASQSNHPVSVAISRKASALITLDSFVEVAGKGLIGEFEGNRYLLGSDLFFKQNGISCPLSSSHHTTVYFSENTHCLTEITLGDQLKSGINEMLRSLAPIKTVLLSGDGEGPVTAVASLAGFSSWKARYNPLQKQEYIRQQKERGEIVIMIGDGINDAPALTTAHAGISVVGATDISIQVSDILLTTDHLDVITKMRKLAMRGRKIVSQNLFWAFFYNCIGIALAAAGLLTPLYAAVAMVLSSLMVLFNAKRVRY